MRRPGLIRSLALGGGATLLGLSVAVASTPSLKVSPHKVRIGGTVKVQASHVAPGKYFYLLLTVPNASHPKASAFVSTILKSSSKGTISSTVRLPLVTSCGAATLYAYQAKSKTGIATHLTLTGCTASGKVPPPPSAPPSGGKGGKTPPAPPKP